MHLDKIINIYEKNVLMYGNSFDIAVLNHLLRLKSIDGDYESYKLKQAEKLTTINNFSCEVGVPANDISLQMKMDKSAPKPESLLCYDKEKLHEWWNNRKNKSPDNSV